jgi:uncharacterized protein (UPF0332 family)
MSEIEALMQRARDSLVAAQNFRNVGDYGVEAHVSREQAELACGWSEEFIRAAEEIFAEEKRTDAGGANRR